MTGLGELSNRLNGAFLAGALSTGCQVSVDWDQTPPCLPLRSNPVLADVFAHHFRLSGMEIGGHAPQAAGTGSTDMGNVSQMVPSIHPMLAIAPAGVSLHTAQFADYAATPEADAMIVAAARSLGGVALDLMADQALLADAWKSFSSGGGTIDVAEALRVD